MKPVLILLLPALLTACTPFFSPGPVGKALKKEVREHKAKEIDLLQVVPFKWDQLFLFTPYTSRKVICKDLRLTEAQCLYHVPVESTDDGEMFMVFRLNGDIVHIEMHSRYNGDFTPVDYPQPITQKQAVFTVISSGSAADGSAWLRLVPKAEKLRSNNSLVPTPGTTRHVS